MARLLEKTRGKKRAEGNMCPMCVLTTVGLISGSASIGGLGRFLIKKSRARSQRPVIESRNSPAGIESWRGTRPKVADVRVPE